MVLAMVGPERMQKFEENRDLDFSTAGGQRAPVPRQRPLQRDTIAIAFRVIPNQVAKLDDLHLPPIVKELTDLPRGLVLVTGHTGSGKSTTLAAMIELINSRYGKHIITLEDPIEYLFENERCMIEQREIGSDCPNFATGLRHVLRQDPDIILVGEMRDLETTSFAITAAETGHLVLSTLHTINAPQTIERIIDIYPGTAEPDPDDARQHPAGGDLPDPVQTGRSAGHGAVRRRSCSAPRPCATASARTGSTRFRISSRPPGGGHAEHGQQHRRDVLQGLHRPG